ncbi:hypothetical protein D1871_04925 [Nakamurella silvestris]|nr:hypothetical protein D1871_04925 [Nakamurella silvestris]
MAADGPGRRRARGGLTGAALVCLALTGCTSGTALPDPTLDSSPAPISTSGSDAPGTSTAADPLALVPSAVPTADARAVLDLFDEFNTTAGGTVTDQQKALVGRMATGSAQAQRDCPPASVTVGFRPVWQELQADPEYAPPTSTATGTAYRIPALVEIYSGIRRVGTDLTMVHLQIDQGRAVTFPLCLS